MALQLTPFPSLLRCRDEVLIATPDLKITNIIRKESVIYIKSQIHKYIIRKESYHALCATTATAPDFVGGWTGREEKKR